MMHSGLKVMLNYDGEYDIFSKRCVSLITYR